jgi:hypothetical protein
MVIDNRRRWLQRSGTDQSSEVGGDGGGNDEDGAEEVADEIDREAAVELGERGHEKRPEEVT